MFICSFIHASVIISVSKHLLDSSVNSGWKYGCQSTWAYVLALHLPQGNLLNIHLPQSPSLKNWDSGAGDVAQLLSLILSNSPKMRITVFVSTMKRK